MLPPHIQPRNSRPWGLIVFLCVLASLLVPGIASASTAPGAETRVWAFDVQEQVRVWGERPLNVELHPGFELVYDEFASDSLLAARGVTPPTVADPKLNDLVNDLYKGAKTKSPIGTGSTADAIRHELATGQAVGGQFHTQKGQEYARALEKWLSKNPGGSAGDRAAAQSILDDLRSALGGN